MNRIGVLVIGVVMLLIVAGAWYTSLNKIIGVFSSSPATYIPEVKVSVNTPNQGMSATSSDITALKNSLNSTTSPIMTRADIVALATDFVGTVHTEVVDQNDVPTEPFFKKYGDSTFTTFALHPEFVVALKKLNPAFNATTMSVSAKNTQIEFNGRIILIATGCFPHNCANTEQLFAFEPATNKVYLLTLSASDIGPSTTSSGKFILYGKPDAALASALCSQYTELLGM